MSLLDVFTVVHVVISLVAIVTGFIAMAQMLQDHTSNTVTGTFLSMTLLTSLSGFGFPAAQITPAHVFGVMSMALLATAFIALYVRRAMGVWKMTYILTAVLSQYLNVVVLIVQSFQKLSPLRVIAPPDAPLSIVLVQTTVAIGFIVFTARALTLARRTPLVT